MHIWVNNTSELGNIYNFLYFFKNFNENLEKLRLSVFSFKTFYFLKNKTNNDDLNIIFFFFFFYLPKNLLILRKHQPK